MVTLIQSSVTTVTTPTAISVQRNQEVTSSPPGRTWVTCFNNATQGDFLIVGELQELPGPADQTRIPRKPGEELLPPVLVDPHHPSIADGATVAAAQDHRGCHGEHQHRGPPVPSLPALRAWRGLSARVRARK